MLIERGWTANGRIPALVDKTSGKPKRVFEGASMQLYLAEKYDKENRVSFQYDSDEYWEMVEWLVWMVSLSSPIIVDLELYSGICFPCSHIATERWPLYNSHPTEHDRRLTHQFNSNQALAPYKARQTTSTAVSPPLQNPTKLNHNLKPNPPDAPEKIPYAINRYQTETKRLYTVLNDRLASERKAHSLPASQAAYLVANKFSLADICVFSWVNWGEWAGVQPSEFPEIKVWMEAIEAREAVQKGMNVPDDFKKMKAIMQDKEKAEEYSKKSSGWIMKGMKEEEEKL